MDRSFAAVHLCLQLIQAVLRLLPLVAGFGELGLEGFDLFALALGGLAGLVQSVLEFSLVRFRKSHNLGWC